jgi:hypothetical protein
MGGDRPRGHTSLTGAVDAQLAVKRDNAGIITVKVEWLKDGQEGAEIVSRLEQVELGADSYGDPIVSCVVVADDPMARLMATPVDQIVRPGAAKLKPKAKLGLDQLHANLNQQNLCLFLPPAQSRNKILAFFCPAHPERVRNFRLAQNQGDLD